jgi:hypothetical protein
MTETDSFRSALLKRSVGHFTTRPVQDRRIIWIWCIGAATLILIVYLIVPPEHRSTSVLLTVVGGLGALAFYFHRRHAEDARFAKELLTEFNDRYDKLGSDLQFAIWRRGDFEKETQLQFIRYFNLCAEEWLFWRAGYIYGPVWEAWKKGMKQYSCDLRVVALWEEEKKTDSYYGFDFRES